MDENISDVVTKLQSQEEDIVRRAKGVESEMQRLKEQKVSLLLKKFRDELSRDISADIADYKEGQKKEKQHNLEALAQQKALKLEKLEKLHHNIGEQIKTLQLMQEDLLEKREEIENASLAAEQYIIKESANNLSEFEQRCFGQVDTKVNEFRGQLSLRNF